MPAWRWSGRRWRSPTLVTADDGTRTCDRLDDREMIAWPEDAEPLLRERQGCRIRSLGFLTELLERLASGRWRTSTSSGGSATRGSGRRARASSPRRASRSSATSRPAAGKSVSARAGAKATVCVLLPGMRERLRSGACGAHNGRDSKAEPPRRGLLHSLRNEHLHGVAPRPEMREGSGGSGPRARTRFAFAIA